MSLPAWNFAQITVTGSVPSVCSSGSGSGGGDGTIAINEKSSVTIPAGTSKVTCSGASSISCKHSGSDLTFKLNGNNCTAGQGMGWQNCGGGSCKSSEQTIITTDAIECKAMY